MFPTPSNVPLGDASVQLDDPCFEQELILQDDLLADSAALDVPMKGVQKRQRRTWASTQIQDNKNEGSSVGSSKKAVHREIVKQRRKEMAGLYASLRSLLPLEYVKGKRAICDHMLEAVNYIKDMNKKIGEMKTRRDNLNTLTPQRAAIDAENSKSNSRNSPDSVKVNLLGDGVEILIRSGVNEESLPLSKVLEELMFGRGLNVTSCVSTRCDQFSLHKLEVELNEAASTDVSDLQQGLVNLIKIA